MQLAMGVQRNAARQHPAVVHAPTGQLTRPWLESLPWPLTGAQNRVLSEIAADLGSPAPMKRLLQGDVGAGKTAVAICAMLQAGEGDHQAALMAPIGVLVQQHYEEIAETCEKVGPRAVLVPGKTSRKPAEKPSRDCGSRWAQAVRSPPTAQRRCTPSSLANSTCWSRPQ